jgi:hypothetical protein
MYKGEWIPRFNLNEVETSHHQGFQSGPVSGTFTRLKSCIVPVLITDPHPQKKIWLNHIYLPHAETAIYDTKAKIFLKQGISRRGWTQLFDLNARIQQLTWSLIFYEKIYYKLCSNTN